MTVAELIAILTTMPQDEEVRIQGDGGPLVEIEEVSVTNYYHEEVVVIG